MVIGALAMALGGAVACSHAVDLCDPAGWYPDHMPPPDECPSFYKTDCSVCAYCQSDLVYCATWPESAGFCSRCKAEDAGAGDASADGPIGSTCAGECIHGPPSGWDVPALVWFGPDLQAPPCPDIASNLSYEGHADLQAPNVCGACQCDAPTGSCTLPPTLTANAAACTALDPSTPHTPFDPPAAWDGSCTINEPVAAGLPCTGGVPCVQSLTIAPLTLSEAGCAPTQLPIPANAPATWQTVARVCKWTPAGACALGGDVCAPQAPSGFRVCVYHGGDVGCSAHGPYQEKHVVYETLLDTRSCSPCACGAPLGSSCAGMVSVFSDDACSSDASLVSDYLIDAAQSRCVDLGGGPALGSKSATAPTYSPGMCSPSGGEPQGSAEPAAPSTLCCVPSP
jgi:hypothetical protein